MNMPQEPKKLQTALWALLAFGCLAATGYLDYITGPEIICSLLYLIPVATLAWQAGKKPGIAIAAACAAVGLIADIASGAHNDRMAIAFWNNTMTLGFLLVAAILLSRLRQAVCTEEALSRNDMVTTAYNSKYFSEVLQAEIERAKRYKRHFTLLYINLDNFKKVNDAYGRKAGDAALWHFVVSISHALRKTDVIGRLGGDEFGCLLTETGYDAARSVITRLWADLEKEISVHKWPISFSMGAVTFTVAPEKSDDAIKMAEELMLYIKEHGKNGVRHLAFEGRPIA
jgi:diguanylate cyclase (GGDEF)-like protein